MVEFGEVGEMDAVNKWLDQYGAGKVVTCDSVIVTRPAHIPGLDCWIFFLNLIHPNPSYPEFYRPDP